MIAYAWDPATGPHLRRDVNREPVARVDLVRGQVRWWAVGLPEPIVVSNFAEGRHEADQWLRLHDWTLDDAPWPERRCGTCVHWGHDGQVTDHDLVAIDVSYPGPRVGERMRARFCDGPNIGPRRDVSTAHDFGCAGWEQKDEDE